MSATRRYTLKRGAGALERDYLRILFNEIPEAIVFSDNAGRIFKVNQEFCRLFGYSEADCRGRFIDDLVTDENTRPEALSITEAVARGQKHALEVVRRRKDGLPVQVSLLSLPIIMRNRQVAVIGIYRDISDRKQAEEALLEEKTHLAQLVETAAEGIVMLDSQRRIIRFNTEFCRMFGYDPSDLPGQTVDSLIIPEGYEEEAAALTASGEHGSRFAIETVRRRKDGSLLHVSIIGSPIIIAGRHVGTYGIYRDISDRKLAEMALMESQRQLLAANVILEERTRLLEGANASLERLSHVDGLTVIPNRRYFEQFYDMEWRRAYREKRWLALVMMDVDFFKSYNDHHGHLAGDECLKRIAQSLRVIRRAGDLVARYGGEEFVAVLASADVPGALHIAERLRQQVKQLQIPHGHSSVAPHVTISLGVAAQIPDDRSSASNLLMKADQALYQAKAMGRDRVEAVID